MTAADIWLEARKRQLPVAAPAQYKRHLDAAEGWVELGNPIEANKELERIARRLRAHPDVLRVRYGVYATAKKWEAAAEIHGLLCPFSACWRH